MYISNVKERIFELEETIKELESKQNYLNHSPRSMYVIRYHRELLELNKKIYSYLIGN